jgi:dihydrofolate synthase/folylpolyglutamate synthase
LVFDLPKYGDGICLARMSELLDVLGIDRARLQNRSVVVTGSNGKGSTAAMCAAIGRAHGLRTGLFTRVYCASRQIRIDDAESAMILRSPEAKGRGSHRRGEKQRSERFGAFEALFALACLSSRNGCEFIVFRPASAAATIRSRRSARCRPA